MICSQATIRTRRPSRSTVDGQSIGRFHQVSGLELTIDSEEIVEGGENNFVHKVPGRLRWPNIVLSRGVTQSDVFFDWARRAPARGSSGTATRSGGSRSPSP
jgi:phage tail-like protein